MKIRIGPEPQPLDNNRLPIVALLIVFGCGATAAARRTITDGHAVALCYLRGMSQPVKLSDNLVLEARLAGELEERSIARQVEFWARLGRSVELLLEGQQVLALCRNANVRPLSACLESVDSPAGRRRVAGFLQSQPFPHYQPHPDRPGMLVRIDADGQRTVGRFVNRQFRPAKIKTKRS
jgi:hypothetical protein